MGIYRLMLAVMVLLSHVSVLVGGFNEGVVAVVQFYLLSGFVMTALVGRYYGSFDRYGPFLVDRAARIVPQFYFYLGLTAFVITVFAPPLAAKPVVDLSGLVANALIVPLDFYMYLLPHSLYMPQTWSLGLEVLFYASFPVLLLLKLRLVATVLSVSVFLFAVSGAINTDIFGYRLLPGTLFMFLLGSFIYEARSRGLPGWLWGAWLACLLLLVATLAVPALDRPYTKEVVLGLVLGLPMMWLLRHQPTGRIDAIAGDLSYGVFLNHNAVIYFLISRGIGVDKPVWAVAIIAICVGLAYLSYVAVEAPFIRLRRAMRDRRSASLVQA